MPLIGLLNKSNFKKEEGAMNRYIVKWSTVLYTEEVVEAIIRAYQSVLKQSKSSRASKAYRTRLENGTVPPEFLPKGVRVE